MYINVTDTYDTESTNEMFMFNQNDSCVTLSVPPSLKKQMRGDNMIVAKSKDKMSKLNFALKNIYFIGKIASLFFALLNVAVMIVGVKTFTLTGNLVGILISIIFYYVFANEELIWRQDSCS